METGAETADFFGFLASLRILRSPIVVTSFLYMMWEFYDFRSRVTVSTWAVRESVYGAAISQPVYDDGLQINFRHNLHYSITDIRKSNI